MSLVSFQVFFGGQREAVLCVATRSAGEDEELKLEQVKVLLLLVLLTSPVRLASSLQCWGVDMCK